MKVKRSIGVYQKDGDSLIQDVPIYLSVDFLKKLFQFKTDEDPELFKVYKLNQEQYFQLKILIFDLSNFDFSMVEMFLECYQID